MVGKDSDVIALLQSIVRLKAPSEATRSWRISDCGMVLVGRTQENGVRRVFTVWFVKKVRQQKP